MTKENTTNDEINNDGLTKSERMIITAYRRLSAAKRILNGTRDPIIACRLAHVHGETRTDIRVANNKGWYGKLQHCHKVWTCPICSLQISNGRRRKLAALVEAERGNGRGAAMITYTLQHNKQQSLQSLLDQLLPAHRAMHSGYRWDKFTKSAGILGAVRAIEITITPNGWHPHIHELMFFYDGKIGKDERIDQLEIMHKYWRGELNKLGADCDYTHGLDITPAYGPVSQYVGKWAIVPELVNGRNKA
jgi:hypothetical protein